MYSSPSSVSSPPLASSKSSYPQKGHIGLSSSGWNSLPQPGHTIIISISNSEYPQKGQTISLPSSLYCWKQLGQVFVCTPELLLSIRFHLKKINCYLYC